MNFSSSLPKLQILAKFTIKHFKLPLKCKTNFTYLAKFIMNQ